MTGQAAARHTDTGSSGLVMKIVELEIHADDLSAQRRFYAEVLHLPTVETPGMLSVQAGSSTLILRQSQDSRIQPYHFAFNIPPHRFEEAKVWLSQRIPLITSSTGEDTFHFTGWNADACYFRDPAGNILEFIARHTLSNDPGQPFDEQSIVCISEIGIASDDVKATVVSLQGQGLPNI